MTDSTKITIPPSPPSTRCALCGEQISRFQDWRVCDDGRAAHRSCEEPDTSIAAASTACASCERPITASNPLTAAPVWVAGREITSQTFALAGVRHEDGCRDCIAVAHFVLARHLMSIADENDVEKLRQVAEDVSSFLADVVGRDIC